MKKSFPGGLSGKESACNAGDLGSIPGLGRSPGEGNGYPLQYSGLENSMDCIVHGVAKSQTRLSNFHFTSMKKRLRNTDVSDLLGITSTLSTAFAQLVPFISLGLVVQTCLNRGVN